MGRTESIIDELIAEGEMFATESKQDTIITHLEDIVDSKLYTIRIDDASATVTYFGYAVPGSAEGSALWRIKRLTVTGGVTDIKFADGNTNFDNVWSNRAALTYT